MVDQPPMVLIELLPTACAVTLLPVLRTAELVTAPWKEALYPAVVAVAETDPELVWKLETALDGTPWAKVAMVSELTAVFP